MDYKYITKILDVEREDKKVATIVTIKKEKGLNISVYSDYNTTFDTNKVIIKIKRDGEILESITLLNTTIFPREIKRTKEFIKVYLEPFKHENNSIQQKRAQETCY